MPTAGSGRGGEYPYGNAKLVADWRSARTITLILTALLAAISSIVLSEKIALANLDAVVLHIAFPAMLAIVLVLAPSPGTRLGRIAKDMTTVCILASIFAGDRIPLMIACFPLVLAASALINRTGWANRFWNDGRRTWP